MIREPIQLKLSARLFNVSRLYFDSIKINFYSFVVKQILVSYRKVLGARSESVYTGNRIVGSNPTLSAITVLQLIYRIPTYLF